MAKAPTIKQAEELSERNVITVKTLRQVRENVMDHRLSLNQIISELSELADEIHMTLALLKAQRGDK